MEEILDQIKDEDYYINNPIFLKWKPRFDFRSFKIKHYLRSMHMNERIIELPFCIQSLVGLSRDSKVLDIGCSESMLPMQLATLGYKVTGVDFRFYPYEHPNFNYKKADILDLPFDEDFFDAVLCISTIEHIGLGYYSDPRQKEKPDENAMRSMSKVLRKGGIFILTVPFGKPNVNEHHRIYDKEGLDKLLKNYHVEDRRYYQSFQKDGEKCNRWIEVDEVQAIEVKSTKTANAVCLIKAVKQ